MSNIETLELLVRSPVKVHLLEHLSKQSATVNQLESRYDVHRRTIVRNLNCLENSGWVTVDHGTYRLTPAARLFLSELIDVLDRLSTASQLAEFFEYVPPGDVDIPLSALETITVVGSDSTNPHGPLLTVQEAVSTASSIRMVAPVVSPIYADLYEEAITSNSLIETVLTTEAVESLRDSTAHSLHERLVDDDARAYITDETLPYGLLITDRSVLVGGYDDGVLRVVLEGDSPSFREWARTAYKRRREATRQLT